MADPRSQVDNLTGAAATTAMQRISEQQSRFTFTGTYTGGAGQPQGSIDGTNYVNLAAIREDNGAAYNGSVGATNFSILVNVSGWKYVRFNGTAVSTGTMTVTQQMTTGLSLPPGAIQVAVASVASVITSSSANALTAGRQGTTNPALNVDASASTSVTGLNIAAAAAAGGLALTVTSSGTDESATVDAKGAGTLTFNGTATGNVIMGRQTTFNNGIISGASTFPIAGQAGASSAGGSIAMTSGAGNGSGNAGGAWSATGGAAGSGNAAGGAVSMTGGAGAGSSAGGAASVVGGASAASSSGNGGAVSITGGALGTSGTGTGGAVTITAGAGRSGGTAGSVTIDTGAANSGTAGTVSIGASNASSITLGAASVPVVTPGPSTCAPGGSTAAAGTTVADAGALPAGTARVYPTTAADDTKGVVVSTSDKVTGRLIFIGNGVSNKILKVYGPSGASINGASADAAFSSASGKGVIMCCLSSGSNTWLAW